MGFEEAMPQQGQRIGEYLLDEKIGQGAFGEVWRAHHHVWSDQLAAVKIPTHPEYVKNLRREGIAMARVDHPNIVRPVGFDPYAEVPYLISEFVPGTSLRPVIVDRKIGFDDAVAIVTQVLHGLDAAHCAGVVHGDVKPENVLVHQSFRSKGYNEPGVIKVTDFGVGLAATATATNAQASGNFQQSSSVNLAATLAYVSPEQRDGSRPADGRSDLFAVGVMLFELLTGERPVGNDLPTELNFKVPVYLDDVFRRAYARREKRFASAREFLDALESGKSRKSPVPLPRPTMKVEPDSVSLQETSHNLKPVEEPEEAEIGFKDDGPFGPRRVSDEDEFGVISLEETVDVDPVKKREAPIEPLEMEQSLSETAPGETAAGTRSGETRADGTRAGDTRAGDSAFAPAVAPKALPAPRKVAPKKPAAPERVDGPPVRTDEPGTIGFDELRNKSVHSPGELILKFRELENARNLDAGERANLILRLNPWASEISKGHLTDFGRQIEVVKGIEAPVYRVVVRDRLETTARRRQEIGRHPAVPEVLDKHLMDADFVARVHLSSPRMNADWFNPVPPPHLRDAVRRATTADTAGVLRQDVRVESAVVFVLRYRYEGKEYDVCFVGPSLRVVAPTLPFEPGAFDLTKRAAAMLDANQVPAGVRELRKCVETGYREQQAMGMLRALRRKLSAAYMQLAGQQLGGIEWMESLVASNQAKVLDLESTAPRDHEHQVDIRAMLVHAGPAVLIALAFCLFAAITTAPSGAYGYLAAAGAAVLCGLIMWRVLGTRLTRTDLGFYHSATLPTLVAGTVAVGFANRTDMTFVIGCAVVLILVIVADVVTFKKLRRVLVRGAPPEQVPNDAMEACVRVESIVNADWDRLAPFFESLPPLAEYVKVKK